MNCILGSWKCENGGKWQAISCVYMGIIENNDKIRKEELRITVSVVIIPNNATPTVSKIMNTGDQNNTALESLSLVAVVTCVLSAAWFVLANVIA